MENSHSGTTVCFLADILILKCFFLSNDEFVLNTKQRNKETTKCDDLNVELIKKT